MLKTTHIWALTLSAALLGTALYAPAASASPELSAPDKTDKLTTKDVRLAEVIPPAAMDIDSGSDSTQPSSKAAPAPVQIAQIEGPEEPEDFGAPAADEEFFPIETPLLVNEAYVGDITAEVTMSGYARISVARFKTLLADRLSEDQIVTLDGFDTDFVLLERLQTAGFPAVYDPGSLSVKMILKVDGIQQVSVTNRTLDRINFDDVEEPAKVSAGLSVIARPRYVHDSVTGATGFAPLAADIRGFFSLGGFKNWSLAYELNALEGRNKPIRREEITLIHDDFEKALRYQIGDIRPSISGFQSGFDILGVGIERNYGAIQPFRNLRPGGRSRFTLERAARVSYEVNGVILGTENFQPGDYDIRDLPLINGANDVRIIVDDEFGSREVGSYSTFVDTELLSADTLLFGANLGLMRDGISAGGFNYGDDVVASAFVEKGVGDNLTLGLQAEAAEAGGYVGGRGVVGLGANLIAAEVGVSAFEDYSTGFSGALRYTHRPFTTGDVTNLFSAQLSHQSEDFQTLGSLGTPRGKQTSITLRDNIRYKNLAIALDGSWQKTAADERSALGLSFTLPIKRVNVSFGARATYSQARDEFSNRLFITLTRNFGRYGTVRHRSITEPFETDTEWRRLSDRSVGSWSARAAVSTGEILDEVTAEASYVASRAEFDVTHRTQKASGFGATQNSITDARIGLGFGFADGAFAIGRPVAKGFAIVEKHETLKGRTVEIARGDESLVSKADGLGSGLVPLSGSYRNQLQNISVDDLPPGYDIGGSQIKLFPGLNTGYKIKVGTDPAVLIIGTLQLADGSPVALAVGKFMPVADDAGAVAPEGYDFFTNRTGRFVVEGVPEGRYRVTLLPDNRIISELDVGAGEDGVLQIGTLTIEEE